jgi:uncharacterized protein YndB with AHSA1/START domain
MSQPAPEPVCAPPGRRFATEIHIDAPRDAVWRALADGGELQRWFALDAAVEPRAGGKITWRWGDLHTWTHRIEVWQPGVRLLTRYDSPVDDGHGGKKPLFVDFLLQGDGGGTTLRVVQSGFGPEADFDKEYDGISEGWPVELRSLKLYLERHRGRDRAVTWLMQPAECSVQEAWDRFVGAEGLGCPALGTMADGAPFTLQTREGDTFTGRVLRCHRREFSGVVTNLDDAWLRLTVWDYDGTVKAWFWLATYGEAKERAAAREPRLRAFLTRLFPPAAAARPR